MAKPANSCYQSALGMLTRREHSRLELKQKLQQKDFDEDEITQVIDTLVEQGYQSDERFSEAFIRVRHQQGKGPIKIAAELRQRGIEHFDLSVFDFFQLASAVREKKFGSVLPDNPKDRAKQQRFLLSRGFSFEQINHVFKS